MLRTRVFARKIQETFKKDSKQTKLLIIQIIILLSLCVLHALEAGRYANFNPINGTFQNFNPVRRLLDGQIPYRDFQDYLGMGHLYFGTVFTFLFGGDYSGSLVAFTFLSFLGMALICIMIGISVFKKKSTVILITNLVLLMLLTQPLFFANTLSGTPEIFNSLNKALGAANSARFIRGLILPISCLLFFLGYKILAKRIKGFEGHQELFGLVGTGIVAGLSFIWSNDYGISCWLCLNAMTFFVLISRTRKIGKTLLGTFLVLAVSLISVFVFIEILTLGHFGAWMRSTFGTGGYQGWYYNTNKRYYIYDVIFNYIILIQALLALIYLIKMMKTGCTKQALKRYGVPAFANMTCFVMVNEYQMISGLGSSGAESEVALSVLFVTIFFEGIRLLGRWLSDVHIRKTIVLGIEIACLAWIISTAKDQAVFDFMTEKEGVYEEALGGNLTYFGDDLINTSVFLDGEDFFSTYASAQEVVEDTYQPSGTDYIIHVLGDQQREDYLKSFLTGDFKYAATINESLLEWEYWIQRANWFFYRELYKGWHPVYTNNYERYWERNAEGEVYTSSDDISVTIADIDESIKKIIIETSSETSGIADVYIDYTVHKKGGTRAKLAYKTNILVKNSGTVYANKTYLETNYLRPSSAEYIPITVVDGYGEVTIFSNPQMSTYVKLNDVQCNTIYTVAFDYVKAGFTRRDEEGCFAVIKNPKNLEILDGAKAVYLNEEKYNISKVEIEDEEIEYLIIEDEESEDRVVKDQYIYIFISTNEASNELIPEVLQKNNMLRVVR